MQNGGGGGGIMEEGPNLKSAEVNDSPNSSAVYYGPVSLKFNKVIKHVPNLSMRMRLFMHSDLASC